MKNEMTCRRAGRPASAFALVLVVVLLSLIVLLLVGLATLARVEGRVTENRHAYAEARRCALVGLQRALGELQRHAGPDTCATTRAAFLPGVSTDRTQWTGVWRLGNTHPVWLVSSPPELPADPHQDSWFAPVTLVAGSTAEIVGAPEDDPDSVRVESVPLTVPRMRYPGWTGSADPVVGRFAYWVGDEGVKVSVVIRDERAEVAGVGGSAPSPRPETGLLWGGLDPDETALAAVLTKVLAYSQLGYADAGFSPTRLKRHYHRATLSSFGVLSNPVDGGLKVAAEIDGGNPYEPTGAWLYDQVFLPQAPPSDATLPRGLSAARFALRNRDDALPPAINLSDGRLASHAWVAGAFNLNSADTDPLAQRLLWRMVLAGARNLTMADGTTRTLTDGELEAFATQMTVVRLRAGYPGTGKQVDTPFRSLEDFVRSGLLETALAATPINDGQAPGDPGFVTSAHVFAMLAPILTVRSDTFVVRAYGAALNPVTGRTSGEAWCEASVQRLPDYVDPADEPEALPGRPVNAALGRRFVVTAFRWMTPADL